MKLNNIERILGIYLPVLVANGNFVCVIITEFGKEKHQYTGYETTSKQHNYCAKTTLIIYLIYSQPMYYVLRITYSREY